MMKQKGTVNEMSTKVIKLKEENERLKIMVQNKN
jgi:hypothetical protein